MSEIWKALLEVQKEAPALQRDGLNPHFKSKYVTLETVLQTVLPILNKHGVVLMQSTDADDNLITMLLDAETGNGTESVMKMHSSKDDAQGWGAAMTYARRYAIMGMLGLVADADDDGNAASAPAKKAAPRKQAPPSDSAFPTNWAQLEQAMKGYGEEVWNYWRGYGAQARELLYPDMEQDGLTPEQKVDFWERTLTASQWLMVKHDPGKFPLPTFSEMREAWAVALDGRELKDPVEETP